MRNIVHIFLLLISSCGLDVSAETVDTLSHIKTEVFLIQPVTFNPETQKELRNDKMLDYYQAEIKKPSIFEHLLNILRSYNSSDNEYQLIVFWITLGILLPFVVWMIYHYKPSFFYMDSKRKPGFQVENEDIHGFDFDELIKKALESGNYSEAIRWNYLQILKNLHEKELISWDANKTVNEYVYELKRPDFKADFKALSQQFVYYRYGNGIASDEDFRLFAALSNQIILSRK